MEMEALALLLTEAGCQLLDRHARMLCQPDLVSGTGAIGHRTAEHCVYPIAPQVPVPPAIVSSPPTIHVEIGSTHQPDCLHLWFGRPGSCECLLHIPRITSSEASTFLPAS